MTIQDLTQERDLAEDGRFVPKDLQLAKWLRAAQKGVSVLQLDEVNAARARTLLALHPIMDIKGELHLPYSDEVLPVTDNAVLVMSANEGDEYQGTNDMNDAFINRYVKVYFNYLTGKKLSKLLSDRSGLPMDATDKVVNVWEKYMSSKSATSPVVSIRALERWCEQATLIGLRDAGIACFASLIAENADQLIEIVEGQFFVNLPEDIPKELRR
jgi:midasin (ATPase involved in ribosome maturation)